MEAMSAAVCHADIDVSMQVLEVNAGNIEEKIKELTDRYDKQPYVGGINSVKPKLWVPPLNEQLNWITKEWSDPESDGTAKLFYLWNRET